MDKLITLPLAHTCRVTIKQSSLEHIPLTAVYTVGAVSFAGPTIQLMTYMYNYLQCTRAGNTWPAAEQCRYMYMYGQQLGPSNKHTTCEAHGLYQTKPVFWQFHHVYKLLKYLQQHVDVEVRRFLYKLITLPLVYVCGIKSRWGYITRISVIKKVRGMRQLY